MLKCFQSLLLLSLLFQFSCKDEDNNEEQPDPELPEAVLQDKVVTEGLTYPWELVWGADNAIWMTERGGKVSRINPETGAVTLVATIDDAESRGEGGLLGMALHPNFTSTPEVFVVYNYVTGGEYSEKVVKYRYNGTALTDPQVIFDGIGALGHHNGSRLVISTDLKLYITTGDAGSESWAQRLDSPNGKVLRINLDGSVPADNPISGSPIWSFGHRNAQGLVLVNGKLYSSEHGPEKDDEINIIQKGRNHGWPNVNGFCDEESEQNFCEENDVVEPLKAYTPTIAVSGMDYYNNGQIPQWKNSLLVATLKDQTLYQFKLNDSGDEITETNEFYRSKYGRLRDILVAPNGKVYLCTSNGSNDKIIEISRSN
ncbi:PQQ-dependent sugar dehydrogenase [Pontibacter sp. KCTC 32443]|uniref:PQQ-dependent sugar dehydrogenase n=1 Tax=Pontibacter TaxID=323449 RepID=UPI00164CDF1B|nr:MULTISPECIES: PQQ-dependent sugar dehydrogenase [Pontibacter]MBC5774572.1 PQQ-dependent sugar dehydrogenase [Pontibacter sp. KCTC 32443]